MMKLGEAANRLSRLGVLAPEGVEWVMAVANRNFIIHQCDEIDRASLEPLFTEAAATVEAAADWRDPGE